MHWRQNCCFARKYVLKRLVNQKQDIIHPLASTLPQSALHCYVVIVETVEILERLLKIGDRPQDLGASQLIEK